MRWVFRIAVILVFVVLVLIGGLLLLPGDRLARLAADQIRAQTGRDVTFSGDVGLSFWPVLGVETGPVSVSNADWAGPEPMFQAESLAIGVAAAPLLRRELKIKRIVASAPILRLEQSGNRANWEFSDGADPGTPAVPGDGPAQAASAQPITLDHLALSDARLVLVRDGATVLDQAGVDLTARWPDPGAPLETEVELALGPDPLTARIVLNDLPGFLDGQVAGLALTAETAGGSARFDGRASSNGAASGKVELDSTDLPRFLAALGQPGAVPRGALRAAKFSGEVTYTEDAQLALRNLRADLDGNALTGDADVSLSGKPKVTARISAGDLDLTGLGGPAGASSSDPADPSGGTAADGWSRAPIDASALGLLDGTVALAAQSIRLPGTSLGETRVSLTLDRARAVLKMEPVRVFSGELRGQLVANNRNGLSVGGNLTATDVELNEALPYLAGLDDLHGRISGGLEFLGVGQSEDAIMRSLSGKGQVSVGKGFFTGFDLEELMRSGQGNGGSTVFDGMNATFTMQGGNLQNRDLALFVKGVQIDGEGRVGLGARDLDYTFLPVATHNGRAFRIPVRAVGPWSDLSIRPDLSRALDAELDARKDELKARAEEKVRQKLSEELNAPVTEDQSLEDVLKNKLEEEAKKGLLKLLGGN